MVTFADFGKPIFVCREAGRRSVIPTRRILVTCALSAFAGLLIAFIVQTARSQGNASTFLPALCGLVVLPTLSRRSLLELNEEDERRPLSNEEPHLLSHLEQILTDSVELLDAQAALLTLVDIKTGHQYSWTLPGEDAKRVLPLQKEVPNPPPPKVALYFRAGAETRSFSMREDGQDVYRAVLAEEDILPWDSPFQAILVGQLRFGTRWAGQIALGCTGMSGSESNAVRLLRQMVRMAERSYRSHSVELTRIAAEERERVARDLHDGVAQTLSAVDMDIEVLRRGIHKAPDNNVDEVLTGVQDTLRRKLKVLRVQIEQLRSGCHFSGLEPCLTEFIRQFEIDTGIAAQFFCDLDADRISPPLRLDLIQIICEALSNVRQHSRATMAEIRLSGHHRRIHLTIHDNGGGFDFAGCISLAKLQACGIGPRMICDRVQALDGILFIESSPQTGSRLEITLPMMEYSFSSDARWAAAPLDPDTLFGSPKVSQSPSAVDRPSPRRRA